MIRKFKEHRSLILSILILVLIVTYVMFGTIATSKSADEEGRRIAERAIRRSVMQCYALEGAYPPSIQYLEDHYGLIVDKDRYHVVYKPDMANIMPTIVVHTRTSNE